MVKKKSSPYKWGKVEGHGNAAINTLGGLILGAYMHLFKENGPINMLNDSTENLQKNLLSVQNIEATRKDAEKAQKNMAKFFSKPWILAAVQQH